MTRPAVVLHTAMEAPAGPVVHVKSYRGPAAGAIIKGDSTLERDVQPASWAATVGTWETRDSWTWTCPACARVGVVAGCAVDQSCDGPDDGRHYRRVGLRPDRWTSAPASLARELLGAGTVERMDLLAGALVLAHRTGAAEALEDLAAFLTLEHPHLAALVDVVLERAELHRCGDL